MLYKRLIWLIRKHPYTPALIYFKKIFHFLTFKTSKLPKTVAKKTKNMTSFPCSVRSADFLPYVCVQTNWSWSSFFTLKPQIKFWSAGSLMNWQSSRFGSWDKVHPYTISNNPRIYFLDHFISPASGDDWLCSKCVK